jgi:hypothetical protein
MPVDQYGNPTNEPNDYNQPVPGAQDAVAPVALGANLSPLPAEKLIANPADPDSVTKVFYNPDGTVKTVNELVAPEDLGPEGMPPVTESDAPFSVDTIPTGWNRFPTPEEVAYLNEKYPVEEPPDSSDLTGTITSFTAADPTVVTMDAEDTAALTVGGTITLEALTGDPDTMNYINGLIVEVLSKAPVTLDLDMSAAVVEGLTADYVRNV